jgi:hypothetical protein
LEGWKANPGNPHVGNAGKILCGVYPLLPSILPFCSVLLKRKRVRYMKYIGFSGNPGLAFSLPSAAFAGFRANRGWKA